MSFKHAVKIKTLRNLKEFGLKIKIYTPNLTMTSEMLRVFTLASCLELSFK